MKKKWRTKLIGCVFFLGCLLVFSHTAIAESESNANEADFDQQTITINLIDQKGIPNEKNDTTAANGTDQEAGVTKPVGKFPQTGEIRKASVSIVGILLIFLCLFFGIKQKKRKWGQSNEQ